jgi:transposase
VLRQKQDNEEIIERVAALDIGKAEVVCCLRVPDEDHPVGLEYAIVEVTCSFS